jgi:PKD repeat protein
MTLTRKIIRLVVLAGLFFACAGPGLVPQPAVALSAAGTALPPASTPTQVSVYYVSSVSGNDGNLCASDAPCRTIQHAVDLAVDGDEIRIATLDNVTPATYTDLGDSAVIELSKGLTLRGGYLYFHTTIPPIHTWTLGFVPAPVDGEGARRGLYITGDVTPTLQLLSFANGNGVNGGNIYVQGSHAHFLGTLVEAGTATRGGGLYLDNSAAILSGIIVQRNQASEGGGLYLDGGTPSVLAGLVQENTADRGGGFFGLDSAVRLVATLVLSNTAAQSGGGLYFDGPLTINPLDLPILANSYIRHNQAADGAGVYLRLAVAGLINNVIADNQSTGRGGGLYLYASSPQGFHNTVAQNAGQEGIYLTHQPGSFWPPVPPIPSLPTLTNTIVVSESVGVYVDTTGLFYPFENRATLRGTLWWNTVDRAGDGEFDTGSTNVYSQALFTCVGDLPGCPDPYHLQDASPAVDAGVRPAISIPGYDIFVDIDGQLRPSGAGFDIGADEVQQPGGVYLVPPLSVLLAQPGATVTHTHLLLNTGTTTDTYDLTLAATPGWSVLATASPIELGPQMSATVQVRVTVPATATAGMTETALLTASSVTDPFRQAFALEETTVITVSWADLAVSKEASAVRIAPGDAVHYTLVITNAGPFTGTVAVTLTDRSTPVAAVADIAAPPGCVTDVPSGLVTCTLALPAGPVPVTSSLDLVITTTGTYTGPLADGAQVTGNRFDPDPANNSAAAVVLVWSEGPAIVVTPQAVAVTLSVGMSTTRDLAIANEGGADLRWGALEVPLVPWLAEAPVTGTLVPGASVPVVLTFDAAGLAAGPYTTTLEVLSNDPQTPTVPVAVTLTVLGACDPVSGASFTWAPFEGVAGQPVTFTAVATGTAPIAFGWDWGDGTTGAGHPGTHTYATGGDYTVVLTASNACGQQVVTHNIVVCGPAAGTTFSWQPVFPLTGQAITLTAVATGTTPIAYAWNLGDGSPTRAGESITHTYALTGTYAVVLTATNACGQQVVHRNITVGARTIYPVYLPLIWREQEPR